MDQLKRNKTQNGGCKRTIQAACDLNSSKIECIKGNTVRTIDSQIVPQEALFECQFKCSHGFMEAKVLLLNFERLVTFQGLFVILHNYYYFLLVVKKFYSVKSRQSPNTQGVYMRST